MRLVRLLSAAFLIAVAVALANASTTHADFHCMRIHAVMAGFQGDADIQYVELRMIGLQPNVGGHTIRFYDSSNVLKATFTFPIGVTATNGTSVLIGSTEFNSNTNGGNADFVFAGNTVGANGGDPSHPVQAPGGRVVFAGEGTDFNCNLGAPPVDSVAYGGATADFGTAAVALPNPSDNRALRVNNLNTKPSNNSTEYALAAVSTTTFQVETGSLKSDVSTPRNNSRFVLELVGAVGGIAGAPGVEAAPAAIEGGAGPGAGAIAAIAGGATAAAVIFVTAGAWYARRRRTARASWLDE